MNMVTLKNSVLLVTNHDHVTSEHASRVAFVALVGLDELCINHGFKVSLL